MSYASTSSSGSLVSWQSLSSKGMLSKRQNRKKKEHKSRVTGKEGSRHEEEYLVDHVKAMIPSVRRQVFFFFFIIIFIFIFTFIFIIIFIISSFSFSYYFRHSIFIIAVISSLLSRWFISFYSFWLICIIVGGSRKISESFGPFRVYPKGPRDPTSIPIIHLSC